MGRWPLLSQAVVLSPQFQQEALEEYKARMKGLEAEVKESVRICLRACFPSEAEDKTDRPCGVYRKLCQQDSLTASADAQESCL